MSFLQKIFGVKKVSEDFHDFSDELNEFAETEDEEEYYTDTLDEDEGEDYDEETEFDEEDYDVYV